jgi:Cys-tRNA(Pro)/Cys-tRNA(Cys) deacylase
LLGESRDDFELGGDLTYLAPETFLGIAGEDVYVDEKTDIFALGLVFHQFYTGSLPVFDTSEYEVDESDLSGVHAAESLGVDPDCVFKTLVARGASKGIYVFVIPVADSLDLKKAARAVGEKSIEMVAVKEINGLTGYVRGGCSPVGMKKQYVTVIHTAAQDIPTITVSAGRIGRQVELNAVDLANLIGAKCEDITR